MWDLSLVVGSLALIIAIVASVIGVKYARDHEHRQPRH